MAQKLLESSALSTFCGSLATMIGAGIQLDEATLMLSENRERSHFQSVCREVYEHIVAGEAVALAMEKTQAFPHYALEMISTGARAGRLEEVLRSLEVYYDEEERLFTKLRSSVGYPAALLCIMSIILGFTVLVILPVFSDVYNNMAGSLTTGSYSSVVISIIIGWVALIVMAALAVISLLLVASTTTEDGRQRVMRLLEVLPQTKRAMYQLALSRFTAALATLTASGVNDEEAMVRAIQTVDHVKLRKKLIKAAADMSDLNNPRSLIQVIHDFEVFDPLYARMLHVGVRSGNKDETLANLSSLFFDDAVVQIDRALDSIEPLLAAFLTIAVGATLIAVMLPLIGIMGSIG